MNGFLLYRDPGLGDTWQCPLPNGYAITMIDVTDQGWVYNPKTQPDGVGEQEDAIGGVRTLQVAGRYILGGSDTHWFGGSGDSKTNVNPYFLLDSHTGTHIVFMSFDDLHLAASQLGIQPKLENINVIYSRYRFTWFDVLVVALLFVPLLTYFVLIVRRILGLRRSRKMPVTA